MNRNIDMFKEVEVFRLTKFDTYKCYEFALKTRTKDNKHYTTNELQYLGHYIRSEEWGQGDNHGGAEIFGDGHNEIRIVYDYEGNTCFREADCKT